jgi:hypothetical protein
MAWRVLFWNIQGTSQDNVKLEKVLAVIDLVRPDIIGFAEVGLNFPYNQFGDYEFKEYGIVDRNGDYTPKGLALGIRRCDHLRFNSDLAPMQTKLFTSNSLVDLARPILHAWVNDVEVILCHAPSTSGGQLGLSTVGNVIDYLRDQCRLSRGVYKGFAIGDFNVIYAPYMLQVDEEYEELDRLRNLRTKSVYYYNIKTVDPEWDFTQKSGGKLDFMITCGVFGIADTTHYHTIADSLRSQYIPEWPMQIKKYFPNDDVPKVIRNDDPSLDSVYSVVKGTLESDFKLLKGKKERIVGWLIDHRPVVYEIMNAERGPLGARIIHTNINNTTRI